MEVENSDKMYYFNLSVSSWNCHGLKGNIGYARNLIKSQCVNFICEHWLYPYELSTLHTIFQKENKWSYLKSSMNPMYKDSKGREFGGIGFVCQNRNNVSYRPIECESDRVCALQIVLGENIVTTIIGVYLPFYDGTTKQGELYMDIICKFKV